MTFSIVATDGDAFGVAVASKFLAVGSVVPGAEIGVGAVATQSWAKVSYIADALAVLREGHTASDAVARVTEADKGRETRQLGIVSRTDQATYTGSDCVPWAGGRTGRHGDAAYAIQGNILTGADVVEDMERTWLASDGQSFCDRLLAALLAGDRAGGDSRGRQSAALYAVQSGAGYDESGVLADLRVDDHPDAPRELARLHDLYELFFGHAEDVVPLTGEVAAEVRDRLSRLGFASGDVAQDLEDWVGGVNLETRLSPDGIDARVLEELRTATA